MIPEIGIMIAGYIFARMFDVVTRPIGQRSDWAQAFLVIFCVLSMLATVFISIDLFFAGRSHTPQIQGMP